MTRQQALLPRSSDLGAHFHRSDLQVHTPRDGAWKGQKAVSQAERAAYAKQFVAACREKGLHAVAITDHHDLLFAPIIRAAAQAECDEQGQLLPKEDRLVVFPGVELTLALGRQALLILDADFPEDRLPQVLHALAITPHDPDQGTLPDVQALEHIHSLAELHQKLNEHQWLRDRYIVLPNASDSGHKTIMRKGMQAEYKEMPCVGGYLDGALDKVGQGNKRIFAGDDAAWGNKRLAVFQTSDSRNATFEDLGRHSTWAKWTEPTAEALRQACLGQESRLSHDQPEMPTVFVSRIVVTNSKFLGPIDLHLNTQYNAIIGGRGTGKSTILDYMRWGLCDQAAQAEDDDLANPSLRRERLIENTLRSVEGQVEIHFSINEIQHVVRRSAATGEILLKVGGEDFVKSREEDIRTLLPVHAYSQKQLSSVALRVDELMRFVTSPIQRSLDTVDQQVTELAGKFRENYARLQRARDLEASEKKQRLAEKSFAEQAANLRNALTDLSPDDRAVLDAKPGVDRVREADRAAAQDLREVGTGVEELLGTIRRAIQNQETPTDLPDILTATALPLREARLNLLRHAERTVETLSARVQSDLEETSALHQAVASVNAAIGTFDATYEDVKQRSTAHQARLTELTEVDKKRKAAAELLAGHSRERQSLGDPEAAHRDMRDQLVRRYRERSQLLGDECARLTELSDGLLRASIRVGEGFDSAEQRFRGLIQGSSVRTGRIDDLFAALRNEQDPLATWEAVLNEVEQLGQLEAEAEHTSELTPVLSRLGFPLADQKRIRKQITADGWLDLALTPIRDTPQFEYQTKEEEFIPFSSASAGQQATALLRVLLSQAGMPLIIDQPEEDLDSQVIQGVVTQIWSAKRRRQLIFASHNANLVVNGDAELVVACDYRTVGDQSGGKISLQGAIDAPAVREEITRVMEGGEKAFKLRKERYGF